MQGRPRHRHRRNRHPCAACRPAPQGRERQRDRKGAWARAYHLQQERHSVRPGKTHVTSGIRLGSPAGTTRGFGSPSSGRSPIGSSSCRWTGRQWRRRKRRDRDRSEGRGRSALRAVSCLLTGAFLDQEIDDDSRNRDQDDVEAHRSRPIDKRTFAALGWVNLFQVFQ